MDGFGGVAASADCGCVSIAGNGQAGRQAATFGAELIFPHCPTEAENHDNQEGTGTGTGGHCLGHDMRIRHPGALESEEQSRPACAKYRGDTVTAWKLRKIENKIKKEIKKKLLLR